MHSPSRPTRHLTQALVLLLLLVVAFGCRSGNLEEGEQQLIEDIFRSGLEMKDDPYVRAETLRALYLTEDARLVALAEPLIGDRDPMVRVAALRKLVKAEHPQAYRRALNLFTQGNEAEQYQVLEVALTHDDETLRRALLDRAQRSSAPSIRRRALQEGLLQDIVRARKENNEELLRQELLPSLGRYVDDDDPQIAVLALTNLIEAGQTERAQRFIARLSDNSATVEERRAAARILFQARVEDARPAFIEILESVGAYDPDTLGIPQRRIDDEILRLSVLGLAALGDENFARLAQNYRTDADTDQILDVLDALGPNPSADAAVTLGTAMNDANPRIRRRAIALYGERPDAQISRLRMALGRDDTVAQRMIVSILVERFADEWQDFLDQRLNSDDPTVVLSTLRTMQTFLRTDEELALIAPLAPRLESLATSQAKPNEDDTIANLAAYLLFRTSEEGNFQDIISKNSDPQTRYAYLEFLATTAPRENVALFRDHLHADLFALRLMAATGLARAFADDLDWQFAAAPSAADAD